MTTGRINQIATVRDSNTNTHTDHKPLVYVQEAKPEYVFLFESLEWSSSERSSKGINPFQSRLGCEFSLGLQNRAERSDCIRAIATSLS